ncbi:hypothetical protein [Legionella spiritensis]|uniref:Uncharacterized protein n=1 Tax=Legionella spiritensis TaxID=452 RepID=A0A0W0Z7E3_LEGSP|nr:hypothetical protein [Legionella spiritensis]KTD64847.1 hypothetical protein Lspi_1014 [Legionella spiritensis]SNV40783.1 Uncharacterised protein [Legionella spiritensis]VEG90491.1 Uncharacterised protein [Legionella spiritensis]
MKENHFGYKITADNTSSLVCTYAEIEEDKMLDLLKDIKRENKDGIYWIFKQIDDQPKEQLCIIDCKHQRIYYHYSGEVDDIDDAIRKLTK